MNTHSTPFLTVFFLSVALMVPSQIQAATRGDAATISILITSSQRISTLDFSSVCPRVSALATTSFFFTSPKTETQVDAGNIPSSSYSPPIIKKIVELIGESVLSNLELIGKGFGWLLALTIATLSLLLASISASRTLNGARVNLLVSAHKAYDEIRDDLAKLHLESASTEKPRRQDLLEAEAEHLFDRFWGLQDAQFRYYTAGLIDDDDFRYWMLSRNRQYHANPDIYKFGKVTLRSTWETVLEKLSYRKSFIELMNTSMDVGDHRVLMPHSLSDHIRAQTQTSSRTYYPNEYADKAADLALTYAKWRRFKCTYKFWKIWRWHTWFIWLFRKPNPLGVQDTLKDRLIKKSTSSTSVP